MPSTPSRAANGMVLRMKARPRSVATKSGLRRIRSTQTPASKPITRTDTPSNAPRIPIWAGVAARTSTAVRGSAMPVMPLPKCETVCPSHSLTKSEFFHNPVRYCRIHFFQVSFAHLTLKDGNDGKTWPCFDSTIFRRDMEVMCVYGLMILQGFEEFCSSLKTLLYSYVDA